MISTEKKLTLPVDKGTQKYELGTDARISQRNPLDHEQDIQTTRTIIYQQENTDWLPKNATMFPVIS